MPFIYIAHNTSELLRVQEKFIYLKPLLIVELIGSTTTATGLIVKAKGNYSPPLLFPEKK